MTIAKVGNKKESDRRFTPFSLPIFPFYSPRFSFPANQRGEERGPITEAADLSGDEEWNEAATASAVLR